MVIKSFPKVILLVLFIQVFSFALCKSVEYREKTKDTVIQEISENYSQYNVLKAVFTIEGVMSKKAFRYPGKIQYMKNAPDNKVSLVITVSDPVFLSPLTTITIDGENLHFRDFLNNRSETFPYDNSTITFFSNFPLPSDVIIPLITGQLPGYFLKSGKKSQDGKSFLVKESDFELVAFFQDNIMQMMVLNPVEQFHQITFLFEGSVKNKLNRYFPQTVSVEFAQGDRLRLIYSQVFIE